MSLQMYWYPKCGTCRKAKKFLEEHGVDFKEQNIVDEPPSQEELTRLIQKSELPVKKFFNTCGKKYRELGLSRKLKELDEQEQLKLLASDGMLMKRPIVTDGDKVTVGFKEEEFKEKWLS